MKIAVIQASTQTSKNELIFEETKRAVAKHGYEVFNFGVTAEEPELSYIQVSLAVGLLLNSGSVDFVITGCSSGGGMSIACNTLPNVISGYLPTPTDAFLFGRINNGNCASLPLGVNFGWAGELNLRFTLEKLFEEPFNTGYPAESAERKKRDAELFKAIKSVSHHGIVQIVKQLDAAVMDPVLQRQDFVEFLLRNSTNTDISNYLIEQTKHLNYNR
ncbi:RpiB/LacA/LacB family sugar-phosphate isomerase [Bacillus cereus]|uniref:RpiB/LacA/LacB family sugar-phosphate isomerase n=1 Tax=Bacillus cereus TaxID=1396 RepID=UPI003CFC1E5A